MIRIITKLPAPELLPNRRKHWSKLQPFKKLDYHYAFYLTKSLPNPKFTKEDKLHMTLNFVYPNNRRRDADNMVSGMKSQIDGIFHALNIDDSQVYNSHSNKLPPNEDNPHCEIIIRRIETKNAE